MVSRGRGLTASKRNAFFHRLAHPTVGLGEFDRHFGAVPTKIDNRAILDYMCTTLKSHSPNPTTSDPMFLDLYFATLKAFAASGH